MPRIEPVKGDPNETTPHTDVIYNALAAKANNPDSSPEDREAARTTLSQMYPPVALESTYLDRVRRGH
jgi:hypothetical protein